MYEKKRIIQNHKGGTFDGVDSKYPPTPSKATTRERSKKIVIALVDRFWYVKYRNFDDERTVSGSKRRRKTK